MTTPTPTPRRRQLRLAIRGAALALAIVVVIGALLGVRAAMSQRAAQPADTTTTSTVATSDLDPGGDVDIAAPTTSSTAARPTPLRAFAAPFDKVNPRNPIEVMRAALVTIFSYQPGKDASQLDAATRTLPLLSPPRVDVGFASLAPITGTQWRQWSADHSRVDASAQVPTKGDNPDGATAISRMALVTQRVVTGRHMRQLPMLAVAITARKGADNAWRVTTLQIQQ
ncbi:hypothetical protein GOEFS_119_00140 [Gordonia effusa NBRC 100432]|uniref:Uncharacterized protein n=1 Tax=Gordonia effusa NBRC 100432 TaxID=1077974 RepID=H0R623_9ACTN|nr:hypothetical protein [Gordonia effusa]GAB20524.1 hypothetical protein GOEFS_119_00140 [Gordonia effusa NBRC 100432]